MLAALVLVSPFLRALAFPWEQLLVAALVFVVTALALCLAPRRAGEGGRRGDRAPAGDQVFDRVDGLALLVVGAYLLSTAVAVNPRAAVQEDIKVLSYAAAFWMARHAAASCGRFLAWALVLSGLVQVGFGFAVRAGWPAKEDVWLGERLAGALQYPNALGAYLGAALLVALGLAVGPAPATSRGAGEAAAGYTRGPGERGGRRGQGPPAAVAGRGRRGALGGEGGGRVAAALAAAVLLGGCVLTYSRGAWLSLPVGVLVLAAGRRRAAVADGTRPRTRAAVVGTRSPARAWGAVLLALGALAALVASPPVRGRLAQVGLDDYSTWSRLVFTRDALTMWRDRPLLGAGGGAWDSLYLAYQSYGYWTAQAHNQPAQVLVETGLVGFAAWLLFWGAVAGRAWRRLTGVDGVPAAVTGGARAAADRGAGAANGGGGAAAPAAAGLTAGALAAVVFLLVHSVGDFHLALGAVSLPLWLLAGLAAGPVAAGAAPPADAVGTGRRSETAGSRTEAWRGATAWPSGRAGAWIGPVAGAGLGAAAVASLVLAVALAYGELAARSFEEGDFLAAEEGLQRAAALDPLAGPFRADLAQVELARADVGLEADLRLAERRAREAVAREPFNAGFHALLAEVLERRGRWEEALAELRRAAELHPYAARRWEALAEAATRAAEAALQGKTAPGQEAARPAGTVGTPAGTRADAAVRRYAALAEEAAAELRRRAGSVPAIVPVELRSPASTAVLEQARARLRRLAGG